MMTALYVPAARVPALAESIIVIVTANELWSIVTSAKTIAPLETSYTWTIKAAFPSPCAVFEIAQDHAPPDAVSAGLVAVYFFATPVIGPVDPLTLVTPVLVTVIVPLDVTGLPLIEIPVPAVIPTDVTVPTLSRPE